jgi:hypothetical protein
LLNIPDPMDAAEFLGLLVSGRVNNRSWYGVAQLDDAESPDWSRVAWGPSWPLPNSARQTHDVG